MEHLRRIWRAAGPWRGRILVGAVSLAVLLVVAFIIVQATGGVQQLAVLVDQFKAQLQALGEPVRDWVARTGPWAPLTYLFSKALIFIFVPVAGYPLNVASGALFGLFWGLVLTIVGDTLGGCALFLLSRRLGRPAVARFLGKGRMAQVDKVLDAGLGGWRELLFVRVILPVPFNLVSLAAGLVPTLSLRSLILIISLTELTKIYLVGIGAGLATGEWVPVAASAVALPVIAVAALLTRRRVREALMSILRWRPKRGRREGT
ncbi:MAG: VTT domain-containing protein [Rubrobacteraceae bacterium]